MAPSIAWGTPATEQQQRAVDAAGLVEVTPHLVDGVRVTNVSQGGATSGMFTWPEGQTPKEGYLLLDGKLPAVGDKLRIRQGGRSAAARVVSVNGVARLAQVSFPDATVRFDGELARVNRVLSRNIKADYTPCSRSPSATPTNRQPIPIAPGSMVGREVPSTHAGLVTPASSP